VVSDIVNEYFSAVAKHVADSDCITSSGRADVFNKIKKYENHDSIHIINNNIPNDVHFSFNNVSEETVLKKLKSINPRKSPGFDNIPPKLVKIGAHALSKPLTKTINKCIDMSIFPDDLKRAEVSPIFKKGDAYCKEQYRPVSVLPSISKLLEGLMCDQLQCHFEPLFSDNLSGFRKGHSCEHVLIKFVDQCKFSLDNNEFCISVLTDLSKAFDCLPHPLLLAKLHAYGLDYASCEFMASYFTNRQQRVKIGSQRSEWTPITQGAAQGSILGPFVFNVLINDLLFHVQNDCNIFNYADDNTICCYGTKYEEVYNNITVVLDKMMTWFSSNFMKANPDKFQLIHFGNTHHDDVSLKIGNVTLTSIDVVKLLGVHIDRGLTFKYHIDILCKKAGRKLNVLARLSKSLDEKSKLILFYSFILSHFDYCSLAWFSCSDTEAKQIEKIQRRAMKYIYNDFASSYANLLEKSGRPSMYVQRVRKLMIHVFCAINKICPRNIQYMFEIKERTYNLRDTMSIKFPPFNHLRHGRNSVRYQGTCLCNKLNNITKECED
jgi:hypothetical protein